MKRSDMLKLMIDINLNPPADIANMNDGGQQLIRMQDYILTKMEEAGMIPPKINFDNRVGEEFFNMNVWEDED